MKNVIAPSRSTGSSMKCVVWSGLVGFGLMMIGFVAGPCVVATAQETGTDLIETFQVGPERAIPPQRRIENDQSLIIDELPVKQPKTVSPTKVSTPTQVPPNPEYLPRPTVNEQRILKALNESTEVAFTDNPLEEALHYLEDKHHIEIWIDKQALSDEGINTDQPVTLVMSGIWLKSTLRLLLEPLGLTCIVEDEVLKITTQGKANESNSTRTYPVGDLFSTREEANELVESLVGGLGISSKNKDGRNPLTVSVTCGAIIARISYSHHDQLLQLIRDLREAKSHKPVAGAGQLLPADDWRGRDDPTRPPVRNRATLKPQNADRIEGIDPVLPEDVKSNLPSRR